MSLLAGEGSLQGFLSDDTIERHCVRALEALGLQNKRVLLLIPDGTRTCPIGTMFRLIHRHLHGVAAQLDVLVALGTHQPMDTGQLCRHLDITEEALRTTYGDVQIFNHEWDNPDMLAQVGTISGAEMSEISGGLMTDAVDLTINKRIFDYDQILIVGPTFPHEVVGFSGGWKYFFPGIAGPDIIHCFHWLGALITNLRIIGTKETPVRQIVNRAAQCIDVPTACLSLVVSQGQLSGLYIGTPEEAWSSAADLSRQLHITYKDRPYRQVLGVAPEMYADIWTAGKVMYKLESVVADGGELIIYAPHITQVSVTHGDWLERIGYHVRDYFVKQPDRFRDVPGGILAHSTHVRGSGRYEDGVEEPRITVTLATGIPESTCRSISLGYRDPASIDVHEWQDREAEGVLFVPRAGEILHRLAETPT